MPDSMVFSRDVSELRTWHQVCAAANALCAMCRVKTETLRLLRLTCYWSAKEMHAPKTWLHIFQCYSISRAQENRSKFKRIRYAHISEPAGARSARKVHPCIWTISNIGVWVTSSLHTIEAQCTRRFHWKWKWLWQLPVISKSCDCHSAEMSHANLVARIIDKHQRDVHFTSHGSTCVHTQAVGDKSEPNV